MYRALQRDLTACGIVSHRVHDLRHTLASLCADAGWEDVVHATSLPWPSASGWSYARGMSDGRDDDIEDNIEDEEPEDPELGRGPIARRVRLVAQSRELMRGPHGYGLSQVERAFRGLTRRADAETLLGLLGHQSAVLRGYLIGHVANAMPLALERLYPLFHDDRELESIHGCVGFGGRVGVRLAEQLGSLAWRSGEPYRITPPAIRRRAWSMLDRGAHDLVVPIAVRAACVEAMAGADLRAAMPVVRECLASREPPLLIAALSGMKGLPPLERAETVRALRDHPERDVRAEALMATERLSLPDLQAACEHIVVRDPDVWPRQLAISYLARMPVRSMAVVQAAARDPDRHVRESALRVLTAEDLTGSASFVCEDISRPDETRAIHSSMLDTMFATRTVAGTEVARYLVHLDVEQAGPRWTFVRDALAYVGEQGLTECLDDVRRHLTSGDERVQGAAARAAGQLGDRAAIATMEALLGSADCFVQKGAAEGLAALNAVESLERLRAVLPGTVPTAGMAIEAAIQHLEVVRARHLAAEVGVTHRVDEVDG